MKKIILLWLLPLSLYILNLVLAIINGPTLVNTICAWGSCIFLVLLLAINSIKGIYDSEKEYKKQLKKIEEKIAEYKSNSDFVDYNIDWNNENNNENHNVKK